MRIFVEMNFHYAGFSYSSKIIISMVMDGFVITEESNNPNIVKFKKH
jgi:hypothetical protein